MEHSLQFDINKDEIYQRYMGQLFTWQWLTKEELQASKTREKREACIETLTGTSQQYESEKKL